LACSACDPRADGAQPKFAPWFVDRSAQLGVDFVCEPGLTGKRFLPEMMGGGVALFDADGDGDLDLYFTNGNKDLPNSKGSGAILDRLYENRLATGEGFVDVTAASGISDADYGQGVAVGDIDNDGDNDLVVTELEGLHVYRNDGHGHFEDATAALGLAVSGWCTSCAFFDYDRDGFLDLYVARYVEFDPRIKCNDKGSRPDYCGPLAFNPVSDILLHNEGGTHFTDVSASAGMSSVKAAGLGVVCADFDQDGWPDVFVANDAYANQLWINQHDGTFRDMAFQQGVALNLMGHTEAGMGVVAADFDGDGTLDLFVTHLLNESNILFLNRGAGRGFRDATGASGTGPSSVPLTGFGVVAFDADLDGDLDLFVVNGRVTRGEPKAGSVPPAPWDEFPEPKLLYLNDGHAHFTLATQLAGEVGSALEVSRGLALGDIDDDGDLDFVVGNIASRARVCLNEAPRAGHWLRVRAFDPRLKRDALGTVVTVSAGGKRFVRCCESSSSFISSSDPRAHFGLGRVERVDAIEVLWPDGLSETFACPGLDRTLELRRGEGQRVR
jgi:hypothetical protein